VAGHGGVLGSIRLGKLAQTAAKDQTFTIDLFIEYSIYCSHDLYFSALA